MDVVTLLLFVSAVVVLTVTPGPDLFLIVGRGIAQGRAAALFTAFGFFLAGFVQVPLLALGLAGVVAKNPVLFDVLRYGGGAYLMWRGLRMLLHAGPGATVPATHASAGAAIRSRSGRPGLPSAIPAPPIHPCRRRSPPHEKRVCTSAGISVPLAAGHKLRRCRPAATRRNVKVLVPHSCF